MKKFKRKGFTLVELLAVIVILAVILVIAVPQILRTINASRMGAIESSAKLLAKSAETDYLTQKTLDQYYNATSIACSNVAKLNEDYDLNKCSITYDEKGTATVTLKGADGGKFDGITCTGTKDNICCTKEGEESICNNTVNGKKTYYIVSDSPMYFGNAITDDVIVSTSPSAAIANWAAISVEGKTRAYYLKHVLEDDSISESYVEFIVNDDVKAQLKADYCSEDYFEFHNNDTEKAACEEEYDRLKNGTYVLRGGVDESESESKPVYNANIGVVQDAFQSAYSISCNDNNYEISCSLMGLLININENGNVIIRDSAAYCDNYHICQIYDGESICWSGEGC